MSWPLYEPPAVKQAREVKGVRRLVPQLVTGRVTLTSPLTVDAGGESPVQASRLGWWQPVIGQPVWLLIAVGRTLVLGGIDQPVLSMAGTITGVGTNVATITLEQGGTFTLPTGYAALVSDKAWVAWSPFEWGKGVIAGKIVTSPAGQTPPPVDSDPTNTDPVGRVTTGVTTIPAIDVRTWRGNGWRGDTTKAYQGDWSGTGENNGFWFYGNGFDQLRGATIIKVELFMHRLPGGSGGGEEPRLRAHTHRTRAGTKPPLGASLTGPALSIGQSGWWSHDDLIGWVQSFVTAGGGIAVADATKANYAAFAGLSGDGKDAQTGALRITWERSN